MTSRPRGPLGLVVALPEELKPLAGRLGLSGSGREPRQGIVGRHEVVAILGGLGGQFAGAAAERLVKQFHCVGLVSPGFAGALAADLTTGDVVGVGEAVTSAGEVLSAEAAWVELLRAATDRIGSCLSMDVPVRTPAEKVALRELTGAVVVDMETASVAAVAREHRLPWAGFRAVSDAADQAIPTVVHRRILPEQGRVDTPGMILHVLPRPGHWPELIALARRSGRAARRLADSVAEFLERLP